MIYQIRFGHVGWPFLAILIIWFVYLFSPIPEFDGFLDFWIRFNPDRPVVSLGTFNINQSGLVDLGNAPANRARLGHEDFCQRAVRLIAPFCTEAVKMREQHLFAIV